MSLAGERAQDVDYIVGERRMDCMDAHGMINDLAKSYENSMEWRSSEAPCSVPLFCRAGRFTAMLITGLPPRGLDER